MRSPSIPDLEQLQTYRVTRPGQYEGVKQSLYDSGTYAQAGQTSLNFFQNPIGSTATPKTKAETNMELSGQLPAGKFFLIESVEILFLPTASATAISTGPVADAAQAFLNDVYLFGASAAFAELYVSSKLYLTEAPLSVFPPKTRMDGFAALATNLTTGANTQTRTGYAAWSGRPYPINPPILLAPTMNFSFQLNWPTAVAISAAAKVYVRLDGILYRQSQ